jgi:hypothetical protein
MDHQLMAKEDLNQLGYSVAVDNAVEYDKAKEKQGFVAGKHIDQPIKWWFQR